MVTRRKVVALGAGAAASLAVTGLTVAGCRGGDKPKDASWNGPGQSGTGSAAPSPSASAEPVTVKITPVANATKVSPTAPVVVSVAGGTLKGVTVSAGDRKVAGKLAEDGSWRSTGTLSYNTTYNVTVSVADSAGVASEQTSSFKTLKPNGVAGVTFQANALTALRTGATYGVGQPVMVHFSRTVRDRAAAEKAMRVETSPPVEGRWRWIDGQNAHWRPARYFAAGTRISVEVKLHGVNLGRDVYGENAATHYTIGPSRIAVADGSSHRMKCYIDGKMVRDIPVSMGKGGTAKTPEGKTVNYWTASGVHVIINKQPSYNMTSASYGITDKKDPNFYDEDIKLCNRISYTGEFVHMADWNISAHGRANTSHGCINVGPANAQWFYDTFQVGDVVEVRNTPRQLGLMDGVGDWTIPWSKW
ncbi:Ig-like domain-containing protein [Plantactinospora siamensis]|uniref:Ig-like domain-containing protein n=1 Tax=Plantactinospora siamensis TaxID=555372 RepID=A0ABV6P2P9_9ACTN